MLAWSLRTSHSPWAVGWPYAAAALLAVGAFFTLEGSFAMGLRAETAGR